MLASVPVKKLEERRETVRLILDRAGACGCWTVVVLALHIGLEHTLYIFCRKGFQGEVIKKIKQVCVSIVCYSADNYILYMDICILHVLVRCVCLIIEICLFPYFLVMVALKACYWYDCKYLQEASLCYLLQFTQLIQYVNFLKSMPLHVCRLWRYALLMFLRLLCIDVGKYW